MYSIEIKKLTKSYKDFKLDNITLSLPTGCIMGLIGENGAGKSTTIRAILDMISIDSGEISILGKDSRKLTKDDIGVVLDDIGLSGCLTPMQIEKIMKNTFKNWNTELFFDYIKRFSLPKTKKFKDFSKGMKMKLGIAIALSHNAKILILDEATSGLDPLVRDEILDIFCDFTRNENNSILISSHIVSDLEKICDYIAFLHSGKLLLCEEKDILREQYGIIHISNDNLKNIDPKTIIGKKENSYGTEVLLKKCDIPDATEIFPIDIEQLFIFLTKGVNR